MTVSCRKYSSLWPVPFRTKVHLVGNGEDVNQAKMAYSVYRYFSLSARYLGRVWTDSNSIYPGSRSNLRSRKFSVHNPSEKHVKGSKNFNTDFLFLELSKSIWGLFL